MFLLPFIQSFLYSTDIQGAPSTNWAPFQALWDMHGEKKHPEATVPILCFLFTDGQSSYKIKSDVLILNFVAFKNSFHI